MNRDLAALVGALLFAVTYTARASAAVLCRVADFAADLAYRVSPQP